MVSIIEFNVRTTLSFFSSSEYFDGITGYLI